MLHMTLPDYYPTMFTSKPRSVEHEGNPGTFYDVGRVQIIDLSPHSHMYTEYDGD